MWWEHEQVAPYSWLGANYYPKGKQTMKRACLIVGALVLASFVPSAADETTAAEARQKAVVVDPLDLRKPIPDPGAGLTEKYDGKLVRFAGRVKTSGQDVRTKTYWYDLQTEIVHPTGVATGKKGATPQGLAKGRQGKVQEVVVVRVYFQTAQNGLRPQPAGNAVTVEGRGEIGLVDGSLSIRKATVLDPKFPQLGTATKP